MILFQVVATLAILLILEGLARISFTIRNDFSKPKTYFVWSPDLGWDRRPGFAGLDDCGQHRVFDDRGFVTSDEAKSLSERGGRARILFLGDSNTFGYCLRRDQNFVAATHRLLPDITWVNLGLSGYTSYQGYKALMKHGKEIDPTAIVISFNFNDRRLVLSEDTVDRDSTFQALYRSANVSWHMGDFSYLFRAAQVIVNKIGMSAKKGGSYFTREARLDKLRPRVDVQSYRDNLSKMARWGAERGTKVIFVVLGDSPNHTRALIDGAQQLSVGNYKQAVKHLIFARDRPNDPQRLDMPDPTFPALVRLYLAEAFKLSGQGDEADKTLILNNVGIHADGGFPIVMASVYQNAMRDVGREFNIPVIEAAEALQQEPHVYFDGVHFDAAGHEIVGRLIANVVGN